MYLFNQINAWRNKKNRGFFYEIKLKLFYFVRNLLGFCRGILVSLTGKVRYTGSYRPLIIGLGTELLVRPGCSIILKSDQEILENKYPNNSIFIKASTIGTRPHYLALDPPALNKTRIELLENAELILEEDTIILSGSYISGSHHAKIQIGKHSYISQGVIINSRHLVQIGKNVLVGYQTMMMDYDAHTIIYSDFPANHSKREKDIIIGDNVWIGARVTILKGVTIGRGAIIGANSCVVSDIPANTIAVGNPAKIVRNNVIWQR